MSGLKFLVSIKALEVPDNEAEQDCEVKAYFAYVEQAIEVPTKLDSAYNDFVSYKALTVASTSAPILDTDFSCGKPEAS